MSAKTVKTAALGFGVLVAVGVVVAATADPFWGGIAIIVGLVGNSAARIAAWYQG